MRVQRAGPGCYGLGLLLFVKLHTYFAAWCEHLACLVQEPFDQLGAALAAEDGHVWLVGAASARQPRHPAPPGARSRAEESAPVDRPETLARRTRASPAHRPSAPPQPAAPQALRSGLLRHCQHCLRDAPAIPSVTSPAHAPK